MRWQLLKSITELVPGQCASGTAITDFPSQLFADHFPGFPITPGVLLIEIGAQLAGRLVEISASQSRNLLLLPVLTMVQEAKLRRFVGPNQPLLVEAVIDALREESALCRATVRSESTSVASMQLLFAFDPDGKIAAEDPGAIVAFERREFLRLGLMGFPPGPVSVTAPH